MAVLLKIEELAWGGDAVARHEGRPVFVKGALPGDLIEVELAQDRRGSVRGQLVRLVEPSPARVQPGCPHFGACGGCQWLSLDRPEQARWKQTLLREALVRIGGVDPEFTRIHPLIASPQALRYRQRARLHLAKGALGFSEEGSHQLVDVQECRLLEPALEKALLALKAALALEGAVPRCVDIALACDDKKVSAAFFLSAFQKSALERVERLVKAVGLAGAVVVVEGAPPKLLGDPVLTFEAAGAPGVALHGRPDLFAQVNRQTNALLVGELLRVLGKPSRVLELFAGAGNLTFAMAARGAAVTAIEIAGDSLELARRSAREAKVAGVRFIAGDSLKVARGLAQEGARFDALVLDPPRTGAKGIAEVAAALGVPRIVYISCDPATLARDLKELAGKGFRALAATPVDLFPQTFHVEGVVLLER